LLLLDPLVRVHSIDENRDGEVTELLAYSRSLQRERYLSVLLVHHTRKNVADGVVAGQGLRGLGSIHAFGDSNLYLRRTKQHLILSSEHRAAAASSPVYLRLTVTDAAATHLEVITEPAGDNKRGIKERVLDLLAQGAVLTRTRPPDALTVNNERLGAGGLGASWTNRPHAWWLAKLALSVRRDSFRSPRGMGMERYHQKRDSVSIISLRSLSIIVTTLKETNGSHPMNAESSHRWSSVTRRETRIYSNHDGSEHESYSGGRNPSDGASLLG
jgi:hypothetical protein